MSAAAHLREARGIHQKSKEELEKARKRKDSQALKDACAKGWLSALEATYAYLVKKGVKEEDLPKGGDRGRRYMVNRYFERELRLYYFSLREELHIEGYYEGSLDFDEVEARLEDLNLYIQKVEEAS